MEILPNDGNKDNEESKDVTNGAAERNDTAGTGDDTLGENTEITPIAKEILKDQNSDAKGTQENKDSSERSDSI